MRFSALTDWVVSLMEANSIINMYVHNYRRGIFIILIGRFFFSPPSFPFFLKKINWLGLMMEPRLSVSKVHSHIVKGERGVKLALRWKCRI